VRICRLLPAFASPEQFAGGSIDARTDIYALGVTLWYALSGQLPFSGRTIEEIDSTRGTSYRWSNCEEFPGAVIEVLRFCLACRSWGNALVRRDSYSKRWNRAELSQ